MLPEQFDNNAILCQHIRELQTSKTVRFCGPPCSAINIKVEIIFITVVVVVVVVVSGVVVVVIFVSQFTQFVFQIMTSIRNASPVWAPGL